MRAWFFLPLLVACSAASRPDAGHDGEPIRSAPATKELRPSLRIAVISDLEGVLEPCGCTRDSSGGVDRLSHVVDELRREPSPLLVLAAGELLFPAAASAAEETADLRAQRELEAGAVAALFERLGVDLLAPAARDLERGEAPLQNLLRGRRVALLGEPREALVGMQPTLARQVGTHRVALSTGNHGSERLSKDSDSALFIDLCHGVEECSAPAPARAADLRIRTGFPAAEGAISLHQGALELTGSRQGRELAVVELWPGGTRGAPWRLVRDRPRELQGNVARVARHAMNARVPSDPVVRNFLDQLFARVRSLHAGRVDSHGAANVIGTELAFVGSRTCAACHTQAYLWWLSTPHARAFRTLEERGRELDLDCIGCHVTGFDRPGGATIGRLTELRGVGCESCHGAGGEHANNPRAPHDTLARAAPETLCVQCHDAQHSDDFRYHEKAAQLRVPGHGVPRATPTVRRAEGAYAEP